MDREEPVRRLGVRDAPPGAVTTAPGGSGSCP
ncbi:hypothetical protein J2S66_000341 [Saccharothrix longispora]|uniref:Uncharacterized protein n=1 Tax=Saccharothrix longispora TaxID=33920 RepID=A0ABU1PMR2_9PSEU|nr:hypothetical protein [Saccharothrix longispora]